MHYHFAGNVICTLEDVEYIHMIYSHFELIQKIEEDLIPYCQVGR